MKVIINSKDIWFRLGVECCLQQVYAGADEFFNVGAASHKVAMDNADLIILPLHSYCDYKHLYELSNVFPGLILGVSSSRNIRPGRLCYRGNILWVSCRESIGNVQQLLHTLAYTKLYPHDGKPDFSIIKAKEGVPLSEREMMIIDRVAVGMPVTDIARDLGLRVKTIYAHLDKIKGNFGIRGGNNFHRFMISPLSYYLRWT